MVSKSFDMTSWSNFFDVVLFPLSSFMPMSLLVLQLSEFSFIQDWPEIWKSEIHRLSFAQYLETGADTNLATNVPNEMLVNTAKCQGYSLYRFWVIKENQQGVNLPSNLPPSTQINNNSEDSICPILLFYVNLLQHQEHLSGTQSIVPPSPCYISTMSWRYLREINK